MKFTVPLDAKPQSRPRFSRFGRAFEEPRLKEFKAAVRKFAVAAMNDAAPIDSACKIFLKFYRRYTPTSKKFGDFDNLSKSAVDAISGVCFADDSLIVAACVEKFQDKDSPRIEIEVRRCRQKKEV